MHAFAPRPARDRSAHVSRPASPRLTAVLFSFHTGGSERVGAAVALDLASRGVSTTACATHGDRGPIVSDLEAGGVSCTPLQPGAGGRIGRAVRLIRHLRAHRTNVLHVQHFNVLSIVLVPARLAGVERIVVTEHTDYDMRRNPASRRVARLFGNRADAITVVHQGIADYLVNEIGLRAERICVIPNGVDTERFRPEPHPPAGVREDLGLRAHDVLIGCVGRLHPDKDPLNLVRALATMAPEARAGLHVLLVGDGASRAEIDRLVDREGLREHVTLAGERHDVDAILPALDVFVLPSRTEGLPIALLEAMSCGLPVVATDVGGVAAVVGDAGVVVPAGDPEALATGLLRLTRDAELRTCLGRNARRRALDGFDVRATLERYAEVLVPASGGVD